ncbi:hypothetical protein GCM10010191_78470 [Actinomadura vinacea]|uniref:AMP-binding enzyme C-terminal domain-containing protein n=1 Tax=Actinomadura vinacea TaxID=115336 RepID=A0ABN3K8B9_9ACTN
MVGRASERIGNGRLPVIDVEAELRTHPAVDDVALVGYPGGEFGEQVCAVVVARSTPVTLAELRKHLDDLGMTQWYQPTRLSLIPRLPRNGNGKVRRELLKRWLVGEAELD